MKTVFCKDTNKEMQKIIDINNINNIQEGSVVLCHRLIFAGSTDWNASLQLRLAGCDDNRTGHQV